MSKVIAIDGPAGSGKGSVSDVLANRYGYIYIDTGATYRCVALATLQNNIDINDKGAIIELTKTLDIDFDEKRRTFLNGVDVSREIRSMEVTKIVSPISSIVEVRKILVDLQRKLARSKDVVMEGRDITTVVFPDADYKFYLDSSLEERARRRFNQLAKNGEECNFDEILENIKKRDYNDTHKEVGSLKRTDDQIYIDATNLSIDEVVEKIINVIGSDK